MKDCTCVGGLDLDCPRYDPMHGHDREAAAGECWSCGESKGCMSSCPSKLDKLCGVDPRDLERLGVLVEAGVFRMDGEVLGDDLVLRLLDFQGLLECISLEGIREARALANGLGDLEAKWMAHACLERSREPSRAARDAGCTLIPDGRLAHVQGDHRIPRGQPGNASGLIAWWEHESAWTAYSMRDGKTQSAERIHDRAGFGYRELAELLGHEPLTWRSR